MSGDHVPLNLLERLPIFAGMCDEERQQLVDIATTMTFEPGEVVMRQGKASQNLMVLLEGECQVFTQGEDSPEREIELAKLQPYDHFGEMSFFEEAPHSASIRALTQVRLFRIQRGDYDLLIREGNLAAYKLAYNMLGEACGRLRRMDRWITDLLCNDPSRSPKQISEWSTFRDKLFTNWNM